MIMNQYDEEFIQYPWWVKIIPVKCIREILEDWCWIYGR